MTQKRSGSRWHPSVNVSKGHNGVSFRADSVPSLHRKHSFKAVVAIKSEAVPSATLQTRPHSNRTSPSFVCVNMIERWLELGSSLHAGMLGLGHD